MERGHVSQIRHSQSANHNGEGSCQVRLDTHSQPIIMERGHDKSDYALTVSQSLRIHSRPIIFDNRIQNHIIDRKNKQVFNERIIIVD